MAYRNKTYVIFDGDKDITYYNLMKAWKENDKIVFNFYDAHDIKPLTDRASEETVKKSLRERMKNTKEVIVLIGESTKNLYKFVRWELELALSLKLPIIAVNLNKKRAMDDDRCPAILKTAKAVHISFEMKMIRYALDNFPTEYQSKHKDWNDTPRHYADSVYKDL